MGEIGETRRKQETLQRDQISHVAGRQSALNTKAAAAISRAESYLWWKGAPE